MGRILKIMNVRFLALLGVVGGAACSSNSSPAPAGEATSDAAPSDSGAEASAGDSWSSFAQGFFATYCTSCHNSADTTGRDFSVQANVEKEKLVIRCGVAVAQDPSWSCAASPAPKQFPIGTGPKPSDAERRRIVAWITAGAP